jgi:cysteine desulfurase/selenocysteine lyase
MNVIPKRIELDYNERLRAEFPLLNNSEVVYLDSASSAQKPRAVLAAIDEFYRNSYANIHRGVYPLSEAASRQYEEARQRVCNFISARSACEVIFTRGTTEGINLVAQSWGRSKLRAEDEILISILEHHSNFVPWQMLAEQSGALLKVVGLTKEGRLDCEDFRRKLSKKTKLVALTQMSNALGVVLPLMELIADAHNVGACVLVDAAQSVAHLPIDVQELGADFLVFSGHKLYGPTGIGVLYGKEELLDVMPPMFGGGGMISSVSIKGTEYAELPMKFEAGTPNIAGALGLAAAIEFVQSNGLEIAAAYEAELLRELEGMLQLIPGLRILGPQGGRIGLLSMEIEGVHPLDAAQLLATKNIAVRAGHHCAQPLMEYLGLSATLRASLGIYTNRQDIESFVRALERTIAMLRG